MKKLLLLAALSLLAAPEAYAGDRSWSMNIASRGGVANSANVTQTAGAAAIAIVAQGERAEIEAPHHDPLILFEGGAFVMPYIADSFNAQTGGEVRAYDPVGSYVKHVDVNTVP
jgi:hypothetical protein